MSLQIYRSNFIDPNGNITPINPQLANLYYDELGRQWIWDVANQVWLALPQLQQCMQGSGVPGSLEPTWVDLPALYTDLVTKIIYTWNATTHAWI